MYKMCPTLDFRQVHEGNRLFFICDMITPNQLKVGNIDIKIQPLQISILQPFNCPYLWNKLSYSDGVCCKSYPCKQCIQSSRQIWNWICPTSDWFYLIICHFFSFFQVASSLSLYRGALVQSYIRVFSLLYASGRKIYIVQVTSHALIYWTRDLLWHSVCTVYVGYRFLCESFEIVIKLFFSNTKRCLK